MTWIEMVAEKRSHQPPPGISPPEGAADWYRIENAADRPDETDVFVYDSIGGWGGMYADDFIRDLKAITSPRINLRLNSPGGSVFDGIAIANAIRSHPSHVTTHVDGLAASIASVIALAGNRVVMQPSSQIMIHDASGGCFGNAEEMANMATLLDKQSQNIAAAYSARAGGSIDDWRQAMKNETWYLADEAVTAGLADEAVPLPKSDDAQAAAAAQTSKRPSMVLDTWDLSVFRYAGRQAAPDPVNAVTEPPPVKDEKPIVMDVKLSGAEFEKLWIETARKMVKAEAFVPDPAEEKPSEPIAAVEKEVIDNAPAEVSAHTRREPQMVNVMRQFDEGDIVAVIGVPHEPTHTKGTIACVNGNAYGIIFENADDDTEQGQIYYWYVDDEIQFVAEGADRAGEDDYDENGPAEDEPIIPGYSHPHGVPRDESDDWDSLVAGLISNDPSPSSADEILHNLFKEAS